MNVRYATLSFLLVFILSSIQASKAPMGLCVRLVTHNVLHLDLYKKFNKSGKFEKSSARRQAFQSYIMKATADIYCFQELDEKWLAKTPGFKGKDFSPHHVEGTHQFSSVSSGCVFTLYNHEKFEFLECERGSAFSRGSRYNTYVLLALKELATGKIITVLNTHLFSSKDKTVMARQLYSLLEKLNAFNERVAADISLFCGDLGLNTLGKGTSGTRGRALIQEVFLDNDWFALSKPDEPTTRSFSTGGALCTDFVFCKSAEHPVSTRCKRYPQDCTYLVPHSPKGKWSKFRRGGHFYSDHASLAVEFTCYDDTDEDRKAAEGEGPLTAPTEEEQLLDGRSWSDPIDAFLGPIRFSQASTSRFL